MYRVYLTACYAFLSGLWGLWVVSQVLNTWYPDETTTLAAVDVVKALGWAGLLGSGLGALMTSKATIRIQG